MTRSQQLFKVRCIHSIEVRCVIAAQEAVSISMMDRAMDRSSVDKSMGQKSVTLIETAHRGWPIDSVRNIKYFLY